MLTARCSAFPAEMYQAVGRSGEHSCRLHAMVCYYGEHYQAIVLEPPVCAGCYSSQMQ